MNPQRISTLFTVLALSLSLLSHGQSASAATWAGGDGNWVSDNWGLDAPDGSPGDANYLTEGASLNANPGEVRINDGDSIVHGGVAFVSVNTIVQSGGTMLSNTRLDIRTRYDLNGGTLAGAGSFRVNGGVLNVDGGMFGARVTTPTGIPQNDHVLSFQGTGNSTLIVTENGIVDVHTLKMNDQGAGGNALVEVHGVIAGDRFDRSTLFWQLNKNSLASSATARFVFSEDGITPWTLISNNSLTLGTGANRGLLEADVSALTSDGTTGFTLIDYRLVIQGDGTFGNVTITDSTLGELQLGTFGNLQQGEYFLDMTGGNDGDDVLLFYNNTVPEPASASIVCLGGLLLLKRKRR